MGAAGGVASDLPTWLADGGPPLDEVGYTCVPQDQEGLALNPPWARSMHVREDLRE